MNLKIKLEHAAYAWLLAGQEDSAYEGLDMHCSYGGKPTDADSVQPTQPAFPFVSIMATTTPDADLPGVAAYDLRINYHADSQDETVGARRARMEALEAITQRMIEPPDDSETWSDNNPEGGAFLAFANKPVEVEDEREEWRKPLHVYDLNQQSDPTNAAERLLSDELSFVGTAQTMNSHDDA